MRTRTPVKRRSAGRKAISLQGSEHFVKTRQLMPDNDLIVLVEPAVDGVDLPMWIQDNPALINQLVLKHGALLFRGFGMDKDADGARLNACLPWQPVGPDEFENSAPRHKVGKNVYVASTVPKDQSIFLHSDYTQSCFFADKITFFCSSVPDSGGENPLADNRRILKRIDPQIADKFRRLGWQLIRNYHPSLGLSFEDSFWGRSNAEIEALCRQNQIELQWHDNVPKTIQVRAAIAEHPVTGEEVWFNHVAFWHLASLAPSVRTQMLEEFGLERMPFATYYGDGSVIEDEVAEHIRDAMLAEKLVFEWQQGDFIVADNILSCHGREPYQGTRKLRLSLFNKQLRPAFNVAEQPSSEMINKGSA